MSLHKKFIQYCDSLFLKAKQDREQLNELKLSQIKETELSDISGMQIDMELISFLKSYYKPNVFNWIEEDILDESNEKSSINRKIGYLTHLAFDQLLVLMEKENLRNELAEIKSKGRGRPTKEEKTRINQIQKILKADSHKSFTISIDSDRVRARYIEDLAVELGSYNKAYKKYVEELNEENPGSKRKAVTIRRWFERYKKNK
jgi:ERCC4-type nuclease